LEPNSFKIRKPIQRQFAELYLLITLLSFAASVSCTRLFLELSGYPQIGRGELHIAHVLWGGLFLFIGAILPLIYANRWVYSLSAVFSGVGVGLFIDEVGKFITRSNDYFYPSAAPIVYAFFLLTVLVYLRTRRRKQDNVRANFYFILSDLEEVIDRDLSPEERQRILNRLDRVLQKSTDPDLYRLGKSVQEFITSDRLYLVEERPRFYQKWLEKLRKFEKQNMSRNRYRAALVGGMLGLGTWAVSFPLTVLFRLSAPDSMTFLVSDLVHDRLVRNMSGLNWFEARVGLEGSIGLLLIVSAILLVFNKDRRSISISSFVILFSLTVVNLLVFYFDQFSTIINAMLQFILLLAIFRYRHLYIRKTPG
jgi:hypothetical protein